MAIRLKTKKATGDYDEGASKFFGSPTVPDKLTDKLGSEVIFLMQLRLSDIKDLDKNNVLPHEGYLYIFLDTINSEYSLKPIVKYTSKEPESIITNFNEVVDDYEDLVDDYLIEFEECDDLEEGNKLFGAPNSWNFQDEPRDLLLQFDPLEIPSQTLNILDGMIYIFLGKDRKTFKDVEIVEDIS